jgi:hypothetical protein
MSENLAGSSLALEPLSLSQTTIAAIDSAISERIARSDLQDGIGSLGSGSSSPATNILWRNTATGENLLWLMDHTTYTGLAPLTGVPDLNWEMGGTGDFNGDDQTDIFWHNKATGQTYLWLMNGTNLTGGLFLPTVQDLAWTVGGTGDFNGDSQTDILWHHQTLGLNYLWLMNGTDLTEGLFLPTVQDLAWTVGGTGDFNGDSQTDILWHHQTLGLNYLWLMNGTDLTGGLFLPTVQDLAWQMAGTGDFNSDGQTDILWHHQTLGLNYLWLMNGTDFSNGIFLPTVTDLNWQPLAPFIINPPPASISGTQWNDLNGNGIQDTGEPGQAGWMIYLDQNQNEQLDSGEQFTTTDANGNYSFTGLAAGTYTVAQVAQSGWEQTFPGSPTTGALTPSNLLISTNKTVSEYTPAGTLVRSSAVPDGANPSNPASEQVRDIIVDRNGDIQAYNGTFDPYLSTYDPNTDTWSHHTFLGWSTVNNISYGGIASYQNFVFASDMRTFGTTADEARGIVRFDITDYSAQRFAELGTVNDSNFIDLTIGLDGLLYALEDNGKLSVFNPLTLDLLRSLNLTTPNFQNDFRAIAINATGEIFASNWNGRIYHYSNSGVLLEDVDSTGNNLIDIDVSATGQLVVGDRFGKVILTDESLDNVTSFGVGTDTTFVAFTTNPLFTLGNGVHQVTLTAGQAATGINFGNRQQPEIVINDGAIAEGNNGTKTLSFTVTLSTPSNRAITVNYATANDTAVASSDYTATNGTLTFNPGVTSQTINVSITGDTVFESNETFLVNLSNPVGGVLADVQAIGTIQNDEGLSSLTITLTPQVGGFSRPVHITNAGDGSNRLFIVEQAGQIRIVQNGVVLPTPFLSIGDRVSDGGGEQGLLSVAFSPNYATNGQFYVYYTNNSGDNVVARYQVSANANVANPASEQIILTIPHSGFSQRGTDCLWSRWLPLHWPWRWGWRWRPK